MLEFISSLLPSHPVIVLCVILLCLFLTWTYQKNHGLPPGPYGLPLVGYAFFLNTDQLSQQLEEFCRKSNSDIISINTFGQYIIVLNSYDLMKEVYQKRTDVTDRNADGFFDLFDPNFSGILTNSGRQWKEVRRFSISTLRDFGMGRVGAEEMIQNEAEILIDMIKKRDGEAFDPQGELNIAVSNIICGMVFGQRFEHSDEEFSRALAGMNNLFTHIGSLAVLYLLRYRVCRDYIFKTPYQKMLNNFNEFRDFAQKRIDEHKRDYSGQTTDLIYCFLKEMEKGRDPDVFDETMLKSLIIDFFFAGSETTYSTLRWCLLAMAAYPDIQKKVQDELDHVTGNRAPSMSDKKQTPYTEAVLSEVQRHFTLISTGVDHTNSEGDIEVNGYRIPQKSFIIPNLNAIHHDKKHWKNPDEFDPENFLEDGKVANLERLVPFAIGRRSCAGEALARMELYIFFASLVKNFKIKLETDDTVPDLEGKQYTVYQPKPFKVRMEARY